MQTFQMKLQKALMLGCLSLSGLMLLYALGFSTDIYSLSYHIDESSKLMYVPGAELYTEAQPFNRAFFLHTVYYFILCLAMFLSLSHRRRLYYPSNYLFTLLYAGYSAFLGCELAVHALSYRKAYLENVDFARLKEVTEKLRMRYVESTLLLDLGIAACALLFLTALLLLLNLVLKTIWMRREHWAEEDGTG